MSFDGVFTHVMVEELHNQLATGRVSKIHHPYENELILTIRTKGKNYKLLLSAHPSYARIQLTEIAHANPEMPSKFAMMLRKFLDGAILVAIKQVENDRIVQLTFSKRDELGDLTPILLLVELMGRHSNILLINEQTNKILDTIKHIGSSQNSYRLLLPGAEYVEPPQHKQTNPFTASKEQVFAILSKVDQLSDHYLQENFQGLGKDTATELCFQLERRPNEKMSVWEQFWSCLQPGKEQQPTLTVSRKKEYFTPFSFESLQGEHEQFNTFSELLDRFYKDRAEKDRVKQQGNELIHKVTSDLKKNKNKYLKLKQTLEDTEKAEQYRRKGELLTTFLSQVPRGADHVELENYYEENKRLNITLDPARSPSQNAQKYFQKYQKLNNAVKIVKEQIQQTEKEVNYLETVLSQLELATPSDISIIREELIHEGYIKQKKRKQRKNNEKKSSPEKFYAQDGTVILVGKNNIQNDYLTLKFAKKNDIWLHAKDIPGSHVIIKDSAPSMETLLIAANLAAYYSKYRLSAQVPVDYVAVKHVHKPSKAKPGYVIYDNQKTLYVTPQMDIVEQFSAKNTDQPPNIRAGN